MIQRSTGVGIARLRRRRSENDNREKEGVRDCDGKRPARQTAGREKGRQEKDCCAQRQNRHCEHRAREEEEAERREREREGERTRE